MGEKREIPETRNEKERQRQVDETRWEKGEREIQKGKRKRVTEVWEMKNDVAHWKAKGNGKEIMHAELELRNDGLKKIL